MYLVHTNSWLLNTDYLNNIQDKPNCFMLFIFDIITVCFIAVFQAVVLEAILFGYKGNSKPCTHSVLLRHLF